MPGDNDMGTKRARTDVSLRAERAKTDAELDQRHAKVENDADGMVHAARERVDDALRAARQREAQNSAMRGAADELAREHASDEHASDDEALAEERKRADTIRDAERVEHQVVLASLLAAERGETDSHLLLERADADALLASRDDFLALVSHDLRSLLGIIAMNVDMIERQAQVGPAQVTRYSVSIKRATAQMTRLVSDLLEVASFDAGKIVLQPRRLDARGLVHQITDTFAAVSSTNELELAARTPNRPSPGNFDPDRISQVLINLIGNALKFTPPGGRISVSVEPVGTDLCFAVADSGEGISPEEIETVFERYALLTIVRKRGNSVKFTGEERGLGR